MQQRIVCAANKYTMTFPEPYGETSEETLIILGARHYDSLMHQQIKSLDEYFWSCKTDEVQGFINQRGNFLTREEAFDIAEDNGQIIRLCGSEDKRKLYSENLY